MKTKVLASSLVIVLTVIAFIYIPGFLGVQQGCPIANAQENPCLTQDATISAMQLGLIQAEQNVINAQATVAMLQTEVGRLQATLDNGGKLQADVTPTNPLPEFREDFNNNDRGWAEGASPDGSAEISGGALKLLSQSREGLILFLPDVEVDTEFYIEAKVSSSTFSSGYEVGFWHGDYLSNDYHLFIHRLRASERGVLFLDNDTVVAEVAGTGLRRGDVIALERKDGNYSFYVNDEVKLSHPATPKGSQLGLYASGGFYGDTPIEFDFVVFRPSR